MVRREQIVNNIGTTLNGAISDTVLSATLNNGSVFPAEGDYRLLIDSEVMLVTARSGNSITIVRGVDGTPAAFHSNGANVNVILTAEGLNRYIDDVTGGSSVRNPQRLLDGSNAVLTSSSFSWVNQGTATVVDDAGGGITLKIPETTGGFRMLVMSAPSTPYTITAKFVVGPGATWSISGTSFGLLFRENSTGEFIMNYYELTDMAEVAKFDSPTVFNSFLGSDDIDCDSTYVWQQIEDDGVDLIYRISTDGYNWWQLGTEGRTVFMAGGPDQVGWAMSSAGLANKLLYLKSWVET